MSVSDFVFTTISLPLIALGLLIPLIELDLLKFGTHLLIFVGMFTLARHVRKLSDQAVNSDQTNGEQ